MLASGVQQSGSAIHTYVYLCMHSKDLATEQHMYMYMYVILLFRFFSVIGYYKTLSIAPSAIQWVLAGYLKVKVLVS